MAKSKYEKYIIRDPMQPEYFHQKYMDPFQNPKSPFVPLNGESPIKGANMFVEWKWLLKPFTSGLDPNYAPHKHTFDEIFMWFGSDPNNPKDLGGEIEFWMGEGKEAEGLKFTTSTLVFIPKGTLHKPIKYLRIDRPILQVTYAASVGAGWAGEQQDKKVSSV